RLTHFVGIQTDVTARIEAEESLKREHADLARALSDLRQTETMLIHSEKMNALGQMVAGVAQEINNPVADVNTNIDSPSRAFEELRAAYDRREQLALSGSVDPAMVRAIRKDAKLDSLKSATADLLQSSFDGLKRVRGIVNGLRTMVRPGETEL